MYPVRNKAYSAPLRSELDYTDPIIVDGRGVQTTQPEIMAVGVAADVYDIPIEEIMEAFNIENKEHYRFKIQTYRKIQGLCVDNYNKLSFRLTDVIHGNATCTDQEFALKHWCVKYNLLINYIELHEEKEFIPISEMIKV